MSKILKVKVSIIKDFEDELSEEEVKEFKVEHGLIEEDEDSINFVLTSVHILSTFLGFRPYLTLYLRQSVNIKIF